MTKVSGVYELYDESTHAPTGILIPYIGVVEWDFGDGSYKVITTEGKEVLIETYFNDTLEFVEEV